MPNTIFEPYMLGFSLYEMAWAVLIVALVYYFRGCFLLLACGLLVAIIFFLIAIEDALEKLLRRHK